MLTFNIKTEPEKYFHQLIEVLKIFHPFSQLRKRERDVFGALLYHLHVLEQNGQSSKQLFDYRIKEEIAASVGISKANLYNIYKELRQHQLLEKDEINQKYKFKYLQHQEISFVFRGGDSVRTDVPRETGGAEEARGVVRENLREVHQRQG